MADAPEPQAGITAKRELSPAALLLGFAVGFLVALIRPRSWK